MKWNLVYIGTYRKSVMSGFQNEAGSLTWFHRFRDCVGYIAGLVKEASTIANIQTLHNLSEHPNPSGFGFRGSGLGFGV